MPSRILSILAVLAAVEARADANPAEETGPATEAVFELPDASPYTQVSSRTWLFNDDATLPAPHQGVAVSRLTYSGGNSPTRPFASNLASPGAMLELGAELGVVRGVSVQLIGMRGESYTSGDGATGAQLGIRWAPLATRSTRLVVGAGYLRELSGGDGAWGRVSLEHELGRARLALSVHGEHVFTPGRDGFDVMVTAGADMRIAGPLRAGIEYVGQDLEGLAQDDAEGGARHIVGGVLSVRLVSERLSLVGGPALGLGGPSPRAIGRAAIAYAF
jgi:hypothetical protein